MADLAASIAKARKAGYSDAQIAAYLAKDPNMGPKVQKARKSGYSDAQIVSHLAPKRGPVEDFGRSLVGGLKESVANIADTVSAAGLGPTGVIGRMSTGNPFGMPTPMAVLGGGMFGRRAAATSDKPQGTAGNFGRAIGLNAPNAIAPGSAGARVVNVFAPAIGGEAAAATARAMGAGDTGQEFARLGGSLAGAGVASLRPPNPFQKPENPTAEIMATRGRADPAAMRAKAAELRAAGVDPTLTDVAGDPGRRVIRAVGVKSEVGGEALSNRARETSAAAKPAVMSRARDLGPNRGMTADQLSEAIDSARESAARVNYAQPYATRVPVTEELRSALSGKDGQAAIGRAIRAAEARRDVGALDDLRAIQRALREGAPSGGPFSLSDVTQPKQVDVSAAALDRIQIALGKTARQLQKNEAGDIAAGLTGRQRQVNDALDAVPELGPARADYRAKTQALEVLGKKYVDPLTTDPADYGRWLQTLPPEAQQANQVAVRQQILDRLGKQRPGTFGTLDELSTSPYARENLRQAFGPQVADGFMAQIEARLGQARNASFVDPKADSRTAVLAEDVGNTAQQAVGAVRQGISGDIIGLAARAVDAWRRRGINPQQAEELARIAVDPSQTDAVIQQIAARLAPAQRQEFLSLRNAAMVGAISAGTGIPQAAS